MDIGKVSNQYNWNAVNDQNANQTALGAAMSEFYNVIEDQIKNGPPKIQIGGAEMSVKEWETLIKKVDSCLEKIQEEVSEETEESKEKAGITGTTPGAALIDRMNGKKKAPYSYLADENGMINYNGVVFVCDDKRQTISLGDTSNPDNCLNIPLENGGSLVVNRDNLGDLSSAIGMFSPEDVNRILRAMAQDAKLQQMQNEIEEDKNSIGDGSTNTANNEEQSAEEVVPVELFDTEKRIDMSDVTEEMVRRLVEDRA